MLGKMDADKLRDIAKASMAMDQSTLSELIKFIFSWVILLPVGVIVTGKLLSQRLKLQVGSGQLFRIPLKGIFTIEASGAEVILGFAWYLISLFILGATVGQSVQAWVTVHFGIDPGQFNALGFISSLTSVMVSFIVFAITKAPANTPQIKRRLRRDVIIDELTQKQTGIDPSTIPEVRE